MLHFIRERAHGWVAWFIVGLITIPFALWGVNSYITGPSDIVVATVNGQPIQQAEYQQAVKQYRDRMRTALKDKFDPTVFDSVEIKRNVLDSLIDKKLLVSVGQGSGQRVSDMTLSRMIHATAAFQKDGTFDSERYSLMLARVGLTPEQYESELRTDSIVQELTTNVQGATLAATYASGNLLRLEKQTREIAYGVIPALSVLDKVVVTDEQVQDYYAINASNYLAPERLDVNYIKLSLDSLMSDISISEAEIKSYYFNNKDQFVGPEQLKISHILIEGDDSDATATIENIQTRLQQGQTFSALATELSQDVGSAKQGGDLGFVQRGVMDAAFEDAAYALQSVGDISDIVTTEFGQHLIMLTAIKKPEGKSFEQAKTDVESFLIRQQAETLFYEKAELLADLSYENPDNLEIAAEDLNLEIKTSVEFQRERNTVGIATNPKVVAAAFSEDVLMNDLNSAVIELTKSDLLVLHKNKHTEASQLGFDSVAPAIKEQLRFENAARIAKNQGEKLLGKLKSGEEPNSLFSDSNWHSAQIYGRSDRVISQQILQYAFSTAKPENSTQPEFVGFTAQNGNFVVLKVTEVTEGDLSTISAEEYEGLQSHLNRSYGDSELQAFINELKAKSEIKVFTNYL